MKPRLSGKNASCEIRHAAETDGKKPNRLPGANRLEPA
jgi:hypothetical protein